MITMATKDSATFVVDYGVDRDQITLSRSEIFAALDAMNVELMKGIALEQIAKAIEDAQIEKSAAKAVDDALAKRF